jgi:hypothetical protein
MSVLTAYPSAALHFVRTRAYKCDLPDDVAEQEASEAGLFYVSCLTCSFHQSQVMIQNAPPDVYFSNLLDEHGVPVLWYYPLSVLWASELFGLTYCLNVFCIA